MGMDEAVGVDLARGALNDNQREYLKVLFRGAHQTDGSYKLDTRQQAKLKEMLDAISNARIDVYRSAGFVFRPGNFDINLIHLRGGSFVPSAATNYEHFLYERFATPSTVAARDARELITSQILDVIGINGPLSEGLKTLRTRTEEAIKTAERQAAKERVIPQSKVRVEGLRKSPELTAKEEAEAKVIENERNEKRKVETELKNGSALFKDIDDLTAEANNLEAVVPDAIHYGGIDLRTVAAARKRDGTPFPQSLEAAKNVVKLKTDESEELKIVMDVAQEHMDKIASVEMVGYKPGTIPPAIITSYATAESDFNSARSNYLAKLTEVKTAKAEMERLTDILDASGHKDNLIRLSTIRNEIDGKQELLRQLKDKYAISGGATLTEAELEAYAKKMEQEIKTLEVQLEESAHPDKHWKEYKTHLYEIVTSFADSANYEEIQKRATEKQRRTAATYFVRYMNYPPAYLKTLQVLFGEEVTLSGHEEEFKKATWYLTPARWYSFFGPRLAVSTGMSLDADVIVEAKLYESTSPKGKSRGSSGDSARVLAEAVSQKDIIEFLDNEFTNLLNDTLGTVSVAEKAEYQAARLQVPSANAFQAVEIESISNEIYSYYDVDELAATLPHYVGVGLDDAKALALEVEAFNKRK